MRRVAILAILVAAGCAGSDDHRVIGTWHGESVKEAGKSHPGADLTLDKDHGFRELFGNLDVDGSWSLNGSDLTLRPHHVNGLGVEEASRRMIANADKARDPVAARSLAAGLSSPVVLNLSEDGKTLRAPGQGTGRSVFTKE